MLKTLFGGRYFVTSSKYTIFKGKYLIDAKPKRPNTAFFNFLSAWRLTNTGLKQTEAAIQASEEWKQLPSSMRQQYLNYADKNSGNYKDVLQAYKQKFVYPFKRGSSYSLFTKNIYESRQSEGKFSERSAEISKIYKALKAEEKQALKAKIAEQNKKNQALVEQFLIPQPELSSFAAYKKSRNQSTAPLSQSQISQLERDYQHYLEGHQKKLAQWLSKRGLSYDEFVKLAKQAEKKVNKSIRKRMVQSQLVTAGDTEVIEKEVNKSSFIQRLKSLQPKNQESKSKKDNKQEKEKKDNKQEKEKKDNKTKKPRATGAKRAAKIQ